MGYACPVCDTPQRDGEHLANHLAFTAMLREDGHREWLDDAVPEWEGHGPAELADRVVGHADDAAFEAVFEDTADHGHGRDHDDVGLDAGSDVAGSDGSAADAEAAEVVADARELTARMLDRADGDDGDPADAEE